VTLLDTHVWLWWLSDPELLSPAAGVAIEAAAAEHAIAISAISCWEVAMLVDRGRLVLDRSVDAFVRGTEALPFVHMVDIDPRIAVASTRLSLPHRDPADRMIVATARLLDAQLVTNDAALREHAQVRTVW
jgi:PIN domain nuclease of toxin-antitoxin system